MWEVVLLAEVEDWYLALDPEDQEAVAHAIDRLQDRGPQLPRPTADRVHGSKLHNLKELRPAGGNIRILFVFDPDRQAVLLVAGDKTGAWQRWYKVNIPIAEQRYQDWLDGKYA